MTKRIIISIPQELLNKLSDYCKEHGYTRSEFIRYSVRQLMSRNENIKTRSKKEKEKS